MDYSKLLSAEEIQQSQNKPDHKSQLAYGVMICYFKRNIKFPSVEENSIPLKLISQVAYEIEMESYVYDFSEFDWETRTIKRYRQQIRDHLGFREPLAVDAKEYIEYLKNNVLLQNPSNEVILEQTRLHFESKKVELFKNKPLQRHISSAQYQFEQNLFQTTFDHLNSSDLYLIDQILTEDGEQPNEGIIALADLKKDIPGARLKNVNLAIQKPYVQINLVNY